MMLKGDHDDQDLSIPNGGDEYEERDEQESNDDDHHQAQVSRDEANQSARRKSAAKIYQIPNKPAQESEDQMSEQGDEDENSHANGDDSSGKNATTNSKNKEQPPDKNPQQTRPKGKVGRPTKQQMLKDIAGMDIRRSNRHAGHHVDYSMGRPRKQGIAKKPISKPGPAKGRGRPRKIAAARGEEWEIENILGSRIDADTHEHFYEVKWRGYGSKENTWEPKRHLVNCRAAIAEYEKRIKQRK